MEIRQSTNRLEGQYVPTVLQKAIGEPLRSEQRTGEFLPRVLSRVDMLAIFIAIVLFIPNASIVQGAGSATYLYWVIGTITFLVPGVIVAGQLNRFMPADGAIYVWTHRALGPLWGFFAGFCAWFPGVLVLLAANAGIVSLIQGIGTQIAGPNANWLVEPWQQGMVVLSVLLVAGWLSIHPLRLLMTIAKGVVALYLLGIFVVGLAGIAIVRDVDGIGDDLAGAIGGATRNRRGLGERDVRPQLDDDVCRGGQRAGASDRAVRRLHARDRGALSRAGRRARARVATAPARRSDAPVRSRGRAAVPTPAVSG